jgi:hypothetical protein
VLDHQAAQPKGDAFHFDERGKDAPFNCAVIVSLLLGALFFLASTFYETYITSFSAVTEQESFSPQSSLCTCFSPEAQLTPVPAP